jgi:tetratricopeptide (TPR) repeat protein
MRNAAVVLLFLLASSNAFACSWDSDTLRFEAEGLPDAFHAIVGRFERNPPLYYEMRLNRVTQGLEADPTQLALYDDAGVACDRLGRGDEAIEWMVRKRAQLAEREVDSDRYTDHQYRYLANIGTFYAHRWFRNGADFDQLDDLEAAVRFIQDAIELNPDAHFGREKYQLMALEWVASKPEMPEGE